MSDTLAKVWLRMSEVTPNRKLSEVYANNASLLAPEYVKNRKFEKAKDSLPELVRTRDYYGFEKMVHELVSLKGWRFTLRELRSISKESVLMTAKMRDALFHSFEMGLLSGMDIDPLKEFSKVKGDRFDDLKRKIRETTTRLLQRQIEQRNTFFLDVDTIKESNFAVLVPDILEARAGEIKDLPNDPHLNQVVSTYYGYSVITSIRDIEKWRETFEDICLSFGREVSVRGERVSYRGTRWPHVSDQMHGLLMSLLRLRTVKSENKRIEAARALGEIGDSRAWRVLDETKKEYRGYRERYTRDVFERALDKIGRPRKGGEDK